MSGVDPFAPASADARRLTRRARDRLVDFGRTYLTVALLKSTGLAVLAVVASALNLPVVAAVLITIALFVLVVYAVYSTKLLKAQDRELRWAYAHGKRVKQQVIDARIAQDTATLVLLGERHPPSPFRGASSELRSAVTILHHRLRQAEERAEVAEAVRDGRADDEQRRRLKHLQRLDRQDRPSQLPPVEPIKARRLARRAERDLLETEIQSLATADDIDRAMRTEEVQGARANQRERQEAARKADQAARDRVRGGRTATAPTPEQSMTMSLGANGATDVRNNAGEATPEQIARGETSPAQ